MPVNWLIISSVRLIRGSKTLESDKRVLPCASFHPETISLAVLRKGHWHKYCTFSSPMTQKELTRGYAIG